MRVSNRRVKREYQIVETYEAGIHLIGSEVKSIKGGRIKLEGAFVRIIGSEAYLVNSEIPLYKFARPEGYDLRRTRKLLLHKRQIFNLKTKMAQSNLTVVPLACYTKRGLIKLELGLAKGKKKYMNREEKKRRDIKRDIEREIKGKVV